MILGFSISVQAKLINIITPDYPIVAVSNDYQNGFGPEKVTDRNADTMYHAFLGSSIGVVITLPTPAIVKAIRITSGQDNPDCDPSSYAIEGSIDGINFVVLGHGDILPFRTRLMLQTFTFDNNEPYSFYRISFSSVQNASTAEYASIGEIELLGDKGDNNHKSSEYFFVPRYNEDYVFFSGVHYPLYNYGRWEHDTSDYTPIYVPEPLLMMFVGLLFLRRKRI